MEKKEMHREDEVLVYKEIGAGPRIFRLEEYWEEDDAGYCVSDYILAKHTRLAVYDRAGSLIRRFDFDSREYDKDMWIEGEDLVVRWHPEYNECREDRIHIPSVEEG